MKNEEEIHELQEAKPMATPPPFRQSDEREENESAQEPATSPTLAERIAAIGLDEETTERIRQLTHDLDAESVTTDLLTTLARGITHDADVQNADAAGFLRGRNEKIETVLHQCPDNGDESESTPVFPRYCRRSIWES